MWLEAAGAAIGFFGSRRAKKKARRRRKKMAAQALIEPLAFAPPAPSPVVTPAPAPAPTLTPILTIAGIVGLIALLRG